VRRGRSCLLRCLILLLLAGCAHPLAYTPFVHCKCVPGEYIPGSSQATGHKNFLASFMRGMGEPVLSRSGIRATSSIRLFAIGFKAYPLAIRVDRSWNGSVALVATQVETSMNECPERWRVFERWLNTKRSRRELPAAQWDSLLGLLSEAHVELEPGDDPPLVPLPDGTIVMTVDGVRYLLEQRDPSGYRYLMRSSGSAFVKKAAFSAFCTKMVALSGLHISADRYC